MDWYYIKDGQQVGPVDDPTFTALARQGTIGPSDRVWNASMGSEWSYAADVPGLFPAEAPAWHQATDSRAGRPAGSLTPNASLTEQARAATISEPPRAPRPSGCTATPTASLTT